MGEYFPAGLTLHIVHSLGINCDYDALRAKALGRFSHQFRIVNGGRIDTDFVGTRIQHGANVFYRANAAANGQWNEHVLSDLLDGMDGRIAAFVAGGDIEKA